MSNSSPSLKISHITSYLACYVKRQFIFFLIICQDTFLQYRSLFIFTLSFNHDVETIRNNGRKSRKYLLPDTKRVFHHRVVLLTQPLLDPFPAFEKWSLYNGKGIKRCYLDILLKKYLWMQADNSPTKHTEDRLDFPTPHG